MLPELEEVNVPQPLWLVSGVTGEDVNKRHKRPINEWQKREPSGKAPLGVIEENLEIRGRGYVPRGIVDEVRGFQSRTWVDSLP